MNNPTISIEEYAAPQFDLKLMEERALIHEVIKYAN